MENDYSKEFKVAKVNRTFLATVLVSVLAGYVISAICILVGKIIGRPGSEVYEEFYNNAYLMLLVSQIVLFLPAFVFIMANRKYFVKNLRIKKLKLKTYFLVAAFGLFFIPVISFVNSLSLFFTKNVISDEISGMVQSHSLLSSVFVTALVPCILEELTYRGVFYNEYSRINPRKAMLLSALLFGLLHMNLNQFLYAAVGGVVFALIVEATGSITASMIMHFMINGSAVVLSYLSSMITSGETMNQEDVMAMESGETFSGSLEFMNGLSAFEQGVVSLGIVAAFCVVICIVIYTQIAISEGRYGYVKSLFRKNASDSISSEENEQDAQTEECAKNSTRMITPSLVIAMIICVIVITVRQILGV